MKPLTLFWIYTLIFTKHINIHAEEASLISSEYNEELEEETTTTTTTITSSQQQQKQQVPPSSRQSPPKKQWKPWKKEDYPNPEINQFDCRTTSNRLCDPDGILIDIERRKVSEMIDEIEGKYIVDCEGEKLPIQITVAMANRLDLRLHNGDADRAVEEFTIFLHNKWGVGVNSKCGGTGIVFFLSILDRTLYFSRGDALTDVFTDRRLDRITELITGHLKDQNYSLALQIVVESLRTNLTKGPPTKEELWWDQLETIFPIISGILIIGYSFLKARYDERRQRSYAQVQTQLSQLDRDRALALQGQYQCSSCPICLEPFQKEEGEETFTKGSDGLPLKLLRCGHVFNETCWNEWINNGTGNIRRCPICKQDVGATTNNDSNETAISTSSNNNDDNAEVQQNQQQQENRAIQHFNQERNFRIARLALRFPRYIGQTQIQRWTSPTYDGSLVRDPSFIRSNPRYMNASNNNSGGRYSSHSSFGGGSSGGGRGGRW